MNLNAGNRIEAIAEELAAALWNAPAGQPPLDTITPVLCRQPEFAPNPIAKHWQEPNTNCGAAKVQRSKD